MNRTIRSVHKRIRRTSDRYTRLIRIIVKRADKRLGIALGSSTTPLKQLSPHVQTFKVYTKKTLKYGFRLLYAAIIRTDRWLGTVMSSPSTPLTRLRPYIQFIREYFNTAVLYVRPILKRSFRVSIIVIKRTDKQLYKASQAFAKIVQKYEGKPEMQGMLLGIFAMGSAFFLATADLGTREAIAERAAEDLRYSLSQVVPSVHHDNNLANDMAELQDSVEGLISFYRARMNNNVAAIAFEMISQGYSGSIKVLLGINTEGQLLGVRVLAHTETPGLGDKIEQQKSDWILGFDGLSLDNPKVSMWKVKKDGGHFDQFSGATITPRAVIVAIRRGLELFQRNRNQFLDITQKSDKEIS
ncbi:MAG: Ion-translocating oxidoreductase complex subunit G [Hyphomicrobiaceae bacterium hypho_1]